MLPHYQKFQNFWFNLLMEILDFLSTKFCSKPRKNHSNKKVHKFSKFCQILAFARWENLQKNFFLVVSNFCWHVSTVSPQASSKKWRRLGKINFFLKFVSPFKWQHWTRISKKKSEFPDVNYKLRNASNWQ